MEVGCSSCLVLSLPVEMLHLTKNLALLDHCSEEGIKLVTELVGHRYGVLGAEFTRVDLLIERDSIHLLQVFGNIC